jgi:carboxyl-terminal processing protease
MTNKPFRVEPLFNMRTFLSLLLLTFTVSVSGAIDKEFELKPLVPESEHTDLYIEVLERLATQHYRTKKIDDDLSGEYLSSYIERLDPVKRYFLASDITEFNQWQTKLDDFARRGDVRVGFYIFNRLRERAVSRLQSNIALLEDSEFSFSYKSDETLMLDPDQRDWFDSIEAADKFSINALQDSMIRLILSGKEEAEARELLVKRYRAQLTQYKQRKSDDVFDLYINTLASLYDPHTSYFSPRTMENFKINMSLSLEGIGAELTTKDEHTEVVRVIPGGPADLQGILKPEDKIIGVGQGENEIVDVVGWRIDDVVELIRGKKGSVVRLEISSTTDNQKIIEIVRDRVRLEDKSAQSEVIEIQSGDQTYKLGVIEIPTFYMDFNAYRRNDPNFKSSSRDVFRLLQELEEENVDGIILDLRNNGGGSLLEASALTDLFINTGPVVQIKDSNKRIDRNRRAFSKAVYTGPLLVLINRLSASASEIFAGAMQDYGRALVVGSQSYGKGTVQDVTALSDGQLKLTVSKFYRVSGDSTQHRGVIPDIKLPSIYNSDEIGESEQENALLWDQIHPVPHQSSDQLKSIIQPLVIRHTERAYTDPNFVHMIDKLNLTQNWSEDQSLSLNLEKRRERNDSRDEALLALENQRRIDQKLKPHASFSDWEKYRENNKDSDDNDATTPESDPILNEAAHILSDQIQLQTKSNAKLADIQKIR